MQGANLGLFASHTFKKGKPIGTCWGRYVILPIDDENWPERDDPIFLGCRNRITALHDCFQPIVYPKPTPKDAEQVSSSSFSP
jgi:hypothetical protein